VTEYRQPPRRRPPGYSPGAANANPVHADRARRDDAPRYQREDPVSRRHAGSWDAFSRPGGHLPEDGRRLPEDGHRPGGYRPGGHGEYQPWPNWERQRRPSAGYQDVVIVRAEISKAAGRRAGGAGARHRKPARLGVLIWAGIGVVALTVTLAVATLAAAVLGTQASPLIAMGRIYIVSIPAHLRSSAAYYLSSSTQVALLMSMYLLIELLGCVIGVITARGRAYGALGLGGFALLAAGAVLAMPGSSAADVIPSAVGGLAGIATLLFLVRFVLPERLRTGPAAAR
jgi:hypothetical protein